MGILSRAAGLHIACLAYQYPGDSAEGLALENIYLTVHEPGRCILQGSYDGVASVADGAAFLRFDVILAHPIHTLQTGHFRM